jgi:hypothetical protein
LGKIVLWIASGGTYNVQNLDGPFGGILWASINDANEVVAGDNRIVYHWQATSGWQPLTLPAGATACQVYSAINNRGEIAGKCTVANQVNAYYWSRYDANPLLLPRPGGSGDVFATDINDSGEIVGNFKGTQEKALKWVPTNGAYPSVQILADAGLGAHASGIGADGTVVGFVQGSGYSQEPSYWLSPGRYNLLDVKPGSDGSARKISMTLAGSVIVGEIKNIATRWKLF